MHHMAATFSSLSLNTAIPRLGRILMPHVILVFKLSRYISEKDIYCFVCKV